MMNEQVLKTVEERCRQLIEHVRENPGKFHDGIDTATLYVSVFFKAKPEAGAVSPDHAEVSAPLPPAFIQETCCAGGCGPLVCHG